MSHAEHCPACRQHVVPPPGTWVCTHCGFRSNARSAGARSRSAALTVAAATLLVPAYTLPVMAVERLGEGHADTILSGVWKLWHQGMWGIAIIVFTASLLVPVLKIAALTVLLVAGPRRNAAASPGLGQLYRAVHAIGRWSMLDIFLIAFLCGIVRFGNLATVSARPGALAFAGAVVLTMLATAAFDPRAPLTPASHE